MTKLTILSPEDKLAEIRRLYFAATKHTIGDDLARAVQLLKSMNTEEERERATVYMDGLAQMRSDWAREGRGPGRPSTPKQAGGDGPGQSGAGVKAGQSGAGVKAGQRRRPKGPRR